MLRTIRYVHCFIGNMRKRVQQSAKIDGPLTQQELLDSAHSLLIWTQADGFLSDIKRLKSDAQQNHLWKKPIARGSVLYKLSPMIDEKRILRVCGRLTECSFVEEKPAILPRRHHVTDLIIWDFHERYCHQSHRTVINQLRTRYFYGVTRY